MTVVKKTFLFATLVPRLVTIQMPNSLVFSRAMYQDN